MNKEVRARPNGDFNVCSCGTVFNCPVHGQDFKNACEQLAQVMGVSPEYVLSEAKKAMDENKPIFEDKYPKFTDPLMKSQPAMPTWFQVQELKDDIAIKDDTIIGLQQQLNAADGIYKNLEIEINKLRTKNYELVDKANRAGKLEIELKEVNELLKWAFEYVERHKMQVTDRVVYDHVEKRLEALFPDEF